MPIRIGAVSYLNTKPLIYGLEHRIADCELTLDLPSRLADQLVVGELDIALIPSVEYLRGGSELKILSDACIACQGPVRSVQLLFRKSPSRVRTLALDEGSRTSAVLAQVLLHQRFGVRPNLVSLPIDVDFESCQTDAVLVIGDRAMQINPAPFVECWDLGEHWYRWSGKPFVFAMWVTRTANPVGWDWATTGQALEAARDAGQAHIPQIAAQQAQQHNLSVEDCVTYFRQQLHFRLGIRERAGLELFRSQADSLGLLTSTQYTEMA